jgi:hypothetical protein
MTDTCCCPPQAGNAVCALPAQDSQHLPLNRPATNTCPVCSEKGKPVQGQTVKALLAVSLRKIQEVEYLFCKTPTCPVVYFSSNSEHVFTTEQVRERVYQKEPDAEEVFICYCFRHTVGEIRAASPESHATIVADINRGISTEQCACDLRNPQGSCCLGNVRGLIKQLESQPVRSKAPILQPTV